MSFTVIDDEREAKNGVTETAVAVNGTECTNVSIIIQEQPSSCYDNIIDSLRLRRKQQKDKRDAQLQNKRGLDEQLCKSGSKDDFSQTVETFIEETDIKELDDYLHEPWKGKNLDSDILMAKKAFSGNPNPSEGETNTEAINPHIASTITRKAINKKETNPRIEEAARNLKSMDLNEPDTEIIPSGSIDEESTTSTNEEMSDFNCAECMPVTESKSKIDEVRPKVSFTPNLISPSTESALGMEFASYARCEPANKYKQTNADSRFPEYYQNQNQDFFNIKGYVRSIQTTNETEIGQRSCVLQRNGTPFYQYTQSQVFSVPPRVINVVECPLEFESINLSIYNDFESNSNNINSTPNFPMTSLANPETAANYKIENKESIVEMNQTKCSKTTIEALNSKLRCTKKGPDESLPGGPGNLPCFPKLFD